MGLTFVKSDQEAAATAFVADRRLGLTADRSRVVDYFDVEAAFLFHAPGGKVTVAEADRYRITAEHPFSPRPEDVARATPAAPAAEPEHKQADPPEDKAVKKAEVEDKGLFRRRKKGEK